MCRRGRSWHTIALALFVVSSMDCSSTSGDGADATTNVTNVFDLGGILNSLTPRACRTSYGMCPYGVGAADQPCVCYTYMGPIPGMTVK